MFRVENIFIHNPSGETLSNEKYFLKDSDLRVHDMVSLGSNREYWYYLHVFSRVYKRTPRRPSLWQFYYLFPEVDK